MIRGERRRPRSPRTPRLPLAEAGPAPPPAAGTAASSSWPPGLGERLPAEPSAPALQEFLARRRQADPARFADVSLSVVKLLGSGEYVVELPGGPHGGHFGLAVKDYTHSTAPNRRYPDLATQRLIKAAVAGGPPPYTAEDLTELARHCHAGRRTTPPKVERQVRKSAAAAATRSRVGERFDAIVTGASPKGTWVRIPHPAGGGTGGTR